MKTIDMNYRTKNIIRSIIVIVLFYLSLICIINLIIIMISNKSQLYYPYAKLRYVTSISDIFSKPCFTCLDNIKSHRITIEQYRSHKEISGFKMLFEEYKLLKGGMKVYNSYILTGNDKHCYITEIQDSISTINKVFKVLNKQQCKNVYNIITGEKRRRLTKINLMNTEYDTEGQAFMNIYFNNRNETTWISIPSGAFLVRYHTNPLVRKQKYKSIVNLMVYIKGIKK